MFGRPLSEIIGDFSDDKIDETISIIEKHMSTPLPVLASDTSKLSMFMVEWYDTIMREMRALKLRPIDERKAVLDDVFARMARKMSSPEFLEGATEHARRALQPLQGQMREIAEELEGVKA